MFGLIRLSAVSQQQMTAEDCYAAAFNEMSAMLAGKDSLSIKRAVFMAEWAYSGGRLDYQADFCNEIDRITKFVRLFYDTNKLHAYKTGMQMALNEYFFRPYSGNGYKPYTYDYESYPEGNESWEAQFVSSLLKTHSGQCRSLPWLYKILATELGADVSLAQVPKHCYIMYRDEDNLTPEDWINLELTTHQMAPSFWIKKDFEICDSAVCAGTYMTPLTDVQTVASQMADLAIGYADRFKRYDQFTYYCATRSLDFFPMNPKAWIMRGKSLETMLGEYLAGNGSVYDDTVAFAERLIEETRRGLERTHMTESQRNSCSARCCNQSKPGNIHKIIFSRNETSQPRLFIDMPDNGIVSGSGGCVLQSVAIFVLRRQPDKFSRSHGR